jgi:diguanylate cyclase (GGDEF)-like protein
MLASEKPWQLWYSVLIVTIEQKTATKTNYKVGAITMEQTSRDEEEQSHSSRLNRIQKRIQRLKRLARKYKRAEIIQNALLEISNIATQVASLEEFYSGMHHYLRQLIPADNFFISTFNPQTSKLELPFFSDEKDSHPSILFAKQDLSETLMSGLTGYVFKTGKILLCDNDTFEGLVTTKQIVSLGSASHQWLGVPIKRANTVTGVLVVQSYDENITYGDIEIELMTFICHHIEGVMERLRHQEQLETAIRQRTQELSDAYEKLKLEVQERRRAEKIQKSLFEIADIATSNVDSEDFYIQLHRIISHLLPANNCYIALLDDDPSHLIFPFYASQIGAAPPERRAFRDGLTEYVLCHRRPLLLNKTDINALILAGELYARAPELNQTQKIHHWIGVPLFIQGSVRGALTIYSLSEHQGYQENDLELLTFVCQHIGTAIERRLAAESLKKSHEELEEKVEQRTQALAQVNLSLEQEIGQRRKVEQQLTHDAKHDALTGLPNRAMFMERLSQVVKHVRRHDSDEFALLFIDLDRFKLINDTLGHLEGDRFLIETARRLKLCIRENDTLGRLGGDEFVILLECVRGQTDAIEVSERILSALSQSYHLSNQTFSGSASIGIAIASSNRFDTGESLLRDADAAMYRAKAQGKGCYTLFDKLDRVQQHNEIALDRALRDALKGKQLQLEYVPIANLSSLTTQALEARLVWHHPQQGIIQHAQLTDIAEQCQLQMELDIYALNQLFTQYANPSTAGLDIHVSVCSQHLKHKHALRKLKNTLKQCPFSLEHLLIFFNEQTYCSDSENHINGFEQLHKMGVALGLNHYGTGNSALSCLSFLPIGALKLDPGYGAQLARGQSSQLLRAFSLACNALEIRLFATGIGNARQLGGFIDLGYDLGQGPAIGDSQGKISQREPMLA